MAKTNSFKIAELIRGITFDINNDVLVTTKHINSKSKKVGDATKTSTTQFALDTFAHASYRAARYIVAMKEGTNFHSTEVMLVHDGSVVTLTAYGTLKDTTLATIDADISGSNVRLLVTPASANSTVIKFDRTLVDA
jgi:hypothetical protein|tara:strand:- start:4962 stop:5372 length:411 start_codon:yes stop_codon:yes gene_type:complete